ncbi:hypothetical protein AMTR_s04017p00006700, partial [Amborella trichopoda]
RSPAILQIHPSAQKHGVLALVAACILAAAQANVPVAVHFDHGCPLRLVAIHPHPRLATIVDDDIHHRLRETAILLLSAR